MSGNASERPLLSWLFLHRRVADTNASPNLKSYRLSLAWTRIQPDGQGPVNPKGLDYYKQPDAAGEVTDSPRITYIRDHLRVLRRAMQDGVPVRGYYCWSLMDNFEWAEGYSQRFGLTYVDFAGDRKRTIKYSGYWYARVATDNRVP